MVDNFSISWFYRIETEVVSTAVSVHPPDFTRFSPCVCVSHAASRGHDSPPREGSLVATRTRSKFSYSSKQDLPTRRVIGCTFCRLTDLWQPVVHHAALQDLQPMNETNETYRTVTAAGTSTRWSYQCLIDIARAMGLVTRGGGVRVKYCELPEMKSKSNRTVDIAHTSFVRGTLVTPGEVP